ncbi:MAG: hypothetical protein IK088_00185, partial [Lachnospiraceae bacterium]|nr:hypothetical protein [Lachnospiraceae bacterium]
MYADEKKIFRKDYVYYDTSEAVYFNAYRDGRMAGRISGILQKAANEKYGTKEVRFTRYDVIDDPEVSKALFQAVEDWAKSRGMDTVVGPLGFSDLEREGLLIGGFEHPATFEEQYNAPYYQKHLEALGYGKRVDWYESRIRVPEEMDPKLEEMSEFLIKRYRLHWGEAKDINDFIRRYKDGFFDILDRSYDRIYGTVPFTDPMKEMLIENFKMIMSVEYVPVLLDENDKIVAFCICFPSLGGAIAGTDGKLYPSRLFRLLKAVRHPKEIDFGLIGVDPTYENRGYSVCLIVRMAKSVLGKGILYAETNLNLEDNASIRNLWKRFDSVEHKHRR